MALIDALQKRLKSRPQATPIASQQEQIQKTLAAGTGKAIEAGGPGASHIGEQVAIGGTQAAEKQIQLQGQQIAASLGQAKKELEEKKKLTSQQLAQKQAISEAALAQKQALGVQEIDTQQELNTKRIQAAETQQIKKINNSAIQGLKQLASTRKVTIDNIFKSFEFETKELEFRKDAAKLEQVGFLLAMRDEAYIQELNRIGTERNLREQLEFDAELQSILLGDQTQALLDELGFQRSYNQSEREFKIKMANIDIESAIKLAAQQIDHANRIAIAEGAIEATKGGAEAYYKYSDKE